MHRVPFLAKRNVTLSITLVILFSYLLIFVSKPVHIDDTVFLKTGEFLAQHPWQPFSFNLNWEGTTVSIFNEDNPFFFPYYLSFVLRAVGGSETILHVSLFIFPVLAILAFRGIASRTVDSPDRALILFATSPVFLVCSTSIMADVPLIAFYLLACYFYLRFRETLASRDGWSFGCMIVLAAFTKYIGLTLIPLFFVDAMRRGVLRKAAPYLLLPVLATFLWCIQNLLTVGALHIWESGKSMNFESQEVLRKLIAALSFSGLSVLGFAMFCLNGRRESLIFLTMCVICYIVIHFFNPAHGNVNDALLTLGIAGTCFVSIQIYRADSDLLLKLWLAGMFTYACLAEFVAARVVLLFAPPLLLLFSKKVNGRWLMVCAILNFALSVLIGRADQKLATFYKNFAYELPTQNTHYIAHWGLQYYLEERHLPPFDYETDRLAAGDLIVVPVQAGTSFAPIPQGSGKYRNVELQLEKQSSFNESSGLFVMNSWNDAGWYCHGWGMLPYSWGYGPLEVVKFYRVKKVDEEEFSRISSAATNVTK